LPVTPTHEWTCRTLPIAPSRISRVASRYSAFEWIWLPICVVTPVASAQRCIWRDSQSVCVSGFCV